MNTIARAGERVISVHFLDGVSCVGFFICGTVPALVATHVSTARPLLLCPVCAFNHVVAMSIDVVDLVDSPSAPAPRRVLPSSSLPSSSSSSSLSAAAALAAADVAFANDDHIVDGEPEHNDGSGAGRTTNGNGYDDRVGSNGGDARELQAQLLAQIWSEVPLREHAPSFDASLSVRCE